MSYEARDREDDQMAKEKECSQDEISASNPELFARYLEQQRRLGCQGCGDGGEVF